MPRMFLALSAMPNLNRRMVPRLCGPWALCFATGRPFEPFQCHLAVPAAADVGEAEDCFSFALGFGELA